MKVQQMRRYRVYIPTMCFVSLIVFYGCTTQFNPADSNLDLVDSSRIQLSGSSTIGPLASEIGKRYEKIQPGLRVDVQTGGSSRGIADAKTGLADIGMSSRALKESERDGRRSWPIAMDGVCFITNSENPVNELSRSQLLSIIVGEFDNWKQLGGPDAPIVFINRAAGRSELELITHFFDVKAEHLDADLIAGENQQGIKMVATTPNAISYMSVGASEDAMRRGTSIKMLPFDGVEASVANVESGLFPLSRPLILVTDSNPSQSVIEFIKYAQSEEVFDLVRELSYVPISSR